MTLGEIKIEALKLMFTNYGEDLSAEHLSELTGSHEYGRYLVAMTGSVNRCFADIESRRVLPEKSFTLSAALGRREGQTLVFELAALIPDYLIAERLIYERAGEPPVPLALWEYREGETLRIPVFGEKEEKEEKEEERERYRLIYRPCLPRVLSYTDNATAFPIPDYIAAFIPYWIKGELFREDEPNEAGEARNWYEAAMSRAESMAVRESGAVRSVYAMTEV